MAHGVYRKGHWPPNSPDLNALDYHVLGEMLKAFHKLYPKPKTIPERKGALQQIWNDLPQTVISRAINVFQPVVDILSIRCKLCSESF